MTGLVLAGGESRRMGRPKAGLVLGGDTLIGRVVHQLSSLCSEIIIVTRRPAWFLGTGYKVVRDLSVGQGPLGGLATGLFYARHPWVLNLACDLPFLKPGLLDLIARTGLSCKPGPRAVVPRTSDGWQPLVAAYSKDCLRPALEMLERGGRKVDDLRHHGVVWQDIDEAALRLVDPELESFTNINTPRELDLARDKADDPAAEC